MNDLVIRKIGIDMKETRTREVVMKKKKKTLGELFRKKMGLKPTLGMLLRKRLGL
jgi:hypothetical protein